MPCALSRETTVKSLFTAIVDVARAPQSGAEGLSKVAVVESNGAWLRGLVMTDNDILTNYERLLTLYADQLQPSGLSSPEHPLRAGALPPDELAERADARDRACLADRFKPRRPALALLPLPSPPLIGLFDFWADYDECTGLSSTFLSVARHNRG